MTLYNIVMSHHRRLTVTVAGAGGTTSVATAPGGVLFTEDFDDTDFEDRGWHDFHEVGGNPILPTIAAVGNGAPPGSTNALVINWLPGASQPPWFWMQKLFTETSSIYFRWWEKWSSNYVGSGLSYHPHKFSVMTDANAQYDSPAFNHLTWYVEDNYQSGGIPIFTIQDAQNIDQSQILVDVASENRAVSGCNDGTPDSRCYLYQSPATYANGETFTAGSVYINPTAGATYKGDWIRKEAFAQLNTVVGGIGQSDGIMRYWINGTLALERTNMLFRTGQYPTMKWNKIFFGPYMDASPVNQTVYITNFVAATLRIPAPAVPTLTGISPNTGLEAGGETRTLTGTNFIGVAGNTKIVVNGTDLPEEDVSVTNATTATITMPAGTGAVSIRVVTAGGTGGPVTYTYSDASEFETPDILNNASFESGFDGFNNGGGSNPSNVTRSQAAPGSIPSGTWTLRHTLPSGGGGSGSCFYSFYPGTGVSPNQSQDRLWVRYYFYLQGNVVPEAYKWCIFETLSTSDQFGGFYMFSDNRMGWPFIKEWNSEAARFGSLELVRNGWHYIECDYWRNGDTHGNNIVTGNGEPSVAIWLDGTNVTNYTNIPQTGASGNGYTKVVGGVTRLYAGTRLSNAQMGSVGPMGTNNPGGSGSGVMWVDRVAISTAGRIGP